MFADPGPAGEGQVAHVQLGANKHHALNQFQVSVGPPSAMLANIKSTSGHCVVFVVKLL